MTTIKRIDEYFNSNTTIKTKDCTSNNEEASLLYNECKPKTASLLGKKRKKDNSNLCNICRDGGDLLLCEKCPKSFHQSCLRIKTLDPEKPWYCADCTEKLKRMEKKAEGKGKRTLSARKKKKLEKKKLEKKERGDRSERKVNNKIININVIVNSDNIENQQKLIDSFGSLLKGNNLNNVTINDVNDKADKAERPERNEKIERFDKDKEIFNAKRLTEDPEDEGFKLASFEELNDIEYIISNVIKSNKVEQYINSYLRKVEDQSNPLQYKTSSANKKKSTISTSLSIKNKLRETKEAQLRLEKQKREEEAKKYLNVKYPIDDKELYSNWDKYKLEEKYLIKPQGANLLIDEKVFPRLNGVYDFIHVFGSILRISNDFSIEMLYYSLTASSLPKLNLIKEVFHCLISALVDEDDSPLIALVFKNSYQKKENLLNFTMLSILKHLIQLPKYNSLSLDLIPLITKLSPSSSSTTNSSSSIPSIPDFFLNTNILEKLSILELLIAVCFDLQIIKQKLSDDILLKVELKREKLLLEADLKAFETKKKELERQDKQIHPREKIEKLNRSLDSLATENEHLGRKEVMRLRRELEAERDDFKTMIKESEDLEAKKTKTLIKIEKLTSDIDALSCNSRRLIGKDGLGNEYFVFKNKGQGIRVHVKRKENWFVFSKYGVICEILEALTDKAKGERALAERIRGLNYKLISPDITEDESLSSIHASLCSWVNSMNRSFSIKKDVYLNENYLSPEANLSFIYSTIDFMEKQLSEKLRKEGKHWESEINREEFLTYIKNTKDFKQLKAALLTLNNSFKKPFSSKQITTTKIIDDDTDCENFIPMIDDHNTPNKNYKLLNASNNEDYAKRLCSLRLWRDEEDEFIKCVENSESILDLTFPVLALSSAIIKWSKDSSNKEKEVKENKESKEVKEYKEIINLKDDKDSDFDLKDYNYKDRRTRQQSFYPSYTNTNPTATASQTQTQPRKKMIEWNDDCYICDEPGHVICCENCPNVAHLACIEYAKEPDEWYCDICLREISRRKITRNSTKLK